MSRKKIMSDGRCPICGGRMRLVNVTRINTFCTPEASQYDLSVSNRRAMFGDSFDSSTQELMCVSCCRRSSIQDGSVKMSRKAKRVKKRRSGSAIGWIVFLVILVVAGFFAYKYRTEVLAFLQPAIQFVTNFFKK